ncbi:hypothetical protein BGZ63DRAFT_384349 [Mariannaea sp. PMI_226]|nr:hypothetical protein BGZ63DRAFT_384349 [Mariannaea sp. PMI_226]
MFDSPPPGSNPLSEYGQRQQTQLIDVWYSVHPLSVLVSKTLLLREVRDGTHDEILLATMLADANFSIGDGTSIARGHVLLRWAISQLRKRPLRPTQSPPHGGSSGVSTRIFSGISTAQALVLLAWNALSSFQLRRAVCYIRLASSLVSEIKDRISNSSAPKTTARINGIDVFDVEKEIVTYLYWTTYSLSLWAFIQMGGSHFSSLLPTSLTSDVFLPVTEASSVMIQLDLVSENFSTLQKQKSAIREMWPLAHIASVVAYVFALHPKNSHPTESSTTPRLWQEDPSLSLQRVQQGEPLKNTESACRKASQALMESIRLLGRQATEDSSRNLVFLVYHSMNIQFLFPEQQPMQPEAIITTEIVDQFCASSEEILRLLTTTAEQPPDLFGPAPSLRGSCPGFFCTALDTCARALRFIQQKFQPIDHSILQLYESKLHMLTRRIYDMSQHEFLNQGSSIRYVRRNLKTCMRMTGALSCSSSSSSSSPDLNRMGSIYGSPQRSPHCLFPLEPENPSAMQIPRISVDSSPLYSCGGDALTVASSMRPSSSQCSPGEPVTNSFTPFEEHRKPGWEPSDIIFNDIMDANTLGISNTEHHMSIAELDDLQNTWCPPLPVMMDFDMTGPSPAQTGLWDWHDPNMDATTTGTDMDSIYYYFDRNNKRTA